ncbi:hypothetical protein ACFLWE_01315 [Chloroflexota bacterium]
MAKSFELNAKLNARDEGLSDILLTIFPLVVVPLPKEFEELKLGDQVADGVFSALTRSLPPLQETMETVEETLLFYGDDEDEARENMEKYFLQQSCSDGFPLLPPTEKAVKRMLEGTELHPNHVVGLVGPSGAEATIKKIAINAVMAGCLPQYMPVIIAAVQAITDPIFYLRGIQCTAGMVSPLLIVSGQKLIEQLNINDSYSTIGPGWRANATIGRVIRLIMINLGNAWPGKNDMKAFGSPFKYVTLMAENERGYMGAWEPIRVTEGFSYDQPTVSVMPALSWQIDRFHPGVATGNNTKMLVEILARQAKVKYDRLFNCWGMENLVLLCPTAFDTIRKEQRSRLDFQNMLYEEIQLPLIELFEGMGSSADPDLIPIPQLLLERCRADPNTLVPLFPGPESIKVIVAGAPGPAMCAYINTWGHRAHFVTKPVKLPGNWDQLLEKYKGWESPIVK